MSTGPGAPERDVRAQGPYSLPDWIEPVQRRALQVAAAGAAVCVLGLIFDRSTFFRAYLIAWMLCLGVSLGCAGFGMLQHLTGGGWGLIMRRPVEAASRTLPLLALLFVPILLGLRHLYPWARPPADHADPLLEHKSAYLNVPFFVLRACLYFALWIGFSFVLNRFSKRQDETGDSLLAARMQRVAAPGLAFYILGMTFAAFDWLMSLQPDWYSTIYGLYVIAGQGLSGISFLILVAYGLGRDAPMRDVLTWRHFDDYGKLLLTMVLLWIYFFYSQFLIIWAANLPEEIHYYLVRRHDGWRFVSLALFLLQFVLPLLLLVQRSVRRNRVTLARLAGLVLVMRWIDLIWQVEPGFSPQHPPLPWLHLAALAALGGLWLAAFTRELAQRPLLPMHDPELAGVLQHG